MKVFDSRLWTMDAFKFETHHISTFCPSIQTAILQRYIHYITSMIFLLASVSLALVPLASEIKSVIRLECLFVYNWSQLGIQSQSLRGSQGQRTTDRIGGPALKEFSLSLRLLRPPRATTDYRKQLFLKTDVRAGSIQLILALSSLVSLDAQRWPDFPAICNLVPFQLLNRLERFRTKMACFCSATTIGDCFIGQGLVCMGGN